jgi:uncharacterized protein (DUF697 family)
MTEDATMSETPERSGAPAAEASAGTNETTEKHRDELAARLVDRFSVLSGAAGLIPVPLVDIAVVGGVQLQMLRRLSEIYGVPFSDNRGKAVVASLAGSMIPTSSGMGIASSLKMLPGLGTALSSMVVPLASAGATWVVGKVFIQHFASGGTLLDFNAPDYREFIKAQKEHWRTRSTSSKSADDSATPHPTS